MSKPVIPILLIAACFAFGCISIGSNRYIERGPFSGAKTFGGWVQHAATADPKGQTIMPMGGRTIEPSQGSRVTESAVRGFWKAWRECMHV